MLWGSTISEADDKMSKINPVSSTCMTGVLENKTKISHLRSLILCICFNNILHADDSYCATDLGSG